MCPGAGRRATGLAKPDPPPIMAAMNVLLGTDSLLMRRSGIGRMTLEIAQALRRRDDLAELRLLLHARAHGPGWLDALPGHADADGPAPRARPAPGSGSPSPKNRAGCSTLS